jgi:hypothetical protein
MSAIDLLMGVVKSVAPVAANILLPGSGSILTGLVDSVLPDSHEASEEAKAQAILDDPKLMADLKAKAMELEATIAQEQTKNMSDVNSTIQAELKDGRWYQRAWRPWNGFWFPVVIVLNYVVLPIYLSPKFVVVPAIPWEIFVAWAGVLGVAAYGRNQEKQGPGKVAGGLMNTVKSFIGRR